MSTRISRSGKSALGCGVVHRKCPDRELFYFRLPLRPEPALASPAAYRRPVRARRSTIIGAWRKVDLVNQPKDTHSFSFILRSNTLCEFQLYYWVPQNVYSNLCALDNDGKFACNATAGGAGPCRCREGQTRAGSARNGLRCTPHAGVRWGVLQLRRWWR